MSARDEMVCDRCHRRHDVVWFAPSDVWNQVMRDGDRGNPDRYSFCCPICFIQLAEGAGVKTTGWRVSPEEHDDIEVSSFGSPGLEVLKWRGKTYVESPGRDFAL